MVDRMHIMSKHDRKVSIGSREITQSKFFVHFMAPERYDAFEPRAIKPITCLPMAPVCVVEAEFVEN